MRGTLTTLMMLAAACSDPTEPSPRVAVLAENVNPPGVTISTCGVVGDYVRADAATPGALSIEGRGWVVLPGAIITSDDLLVVGHDVCVTAELDLERRIERGAATEPDREP